MGDDSQGATPDSAKGATPDDEVLGEGGKAALAAERTARRDAEAKATALEQRLAALEDKDKTELQRATDKAATAEAARVEAEAKALRLEVALDKGLSKVQARRLVGTTAEELAGDADELLASFKTPDAGTGEENGSTSPPTQRPSPDLKGGGAPDMEPEADVRKIVEGIPRGSGF